MKCVCDIVVKKFTFAISSPDELLYFNVDLSQRLADLKQHLQGPQMMFSRQTLLVYVGGNCIFLETLPHNASSEKRGQAVIPMQGGSRHSCRKGAASFYNSKCSTGRWLDV